MKLLLTAIVAVFTVSLYSTVHAFCGFYVARADTTLFNQASQVVMVRDEDRTVLTMANDFQGDAKDFAVVIPVPTFLEREQINVGDSAVIEHLDAYTSPRLVEYHDSDPCAVIHYRGDVKFMNKAPMMSQSGKAKKAKSLGVTIEAEYAVGEYDILILSAEESTGLIQWLKDNGYTIPEGAEPVVNSYIKQDMRFFVAKVNIEEQEKLGFTYLRPLQVAYESNKFMLPIRLGTVNAKGTQELFVYALTRTGRVETTNYRTVKLPTGQELPEYVQDEFADFYRDMFENQTNKENGKAVFLEYAWDMNWCDPCAADPLSPEELRSLGVYWINTPQQISSKDKKVIAPRNPPGKAAARDVFVSRLHVRYDRDHFPENLMFQETGDSSNFQGRYVIRHPWKGESTCEAAEAYKSQLVTRLDNEAKVLANLTGWDVNDIRKKLPEDLATMKKEGKWWKKLWK